MSAPSSSSSSWFCIVTATKKVVCRGGSACVYHHHDHLHHHASWYYFKTNLHSFTRQKSSFSRFLLSLHLSRTQNMHQDHFKFKKSVWVYMSASLLLEKNITLILWASWLVEFNILSLCLRDVNRKENIILRTWWVHVTTPQLLLPCGVLE